MTKSKGAPWIRLLVRILLLTVGVTLLSVSLRWLWYLFAPFVSGILLASMTNKSITALEQRLPWKRSYIVLWLLFFAICICTALLWVLLPRFWREMWDLGVLWQSILPEAFRILEEIEGKVSSWLSLENTAWVSEIATWMTSLLAMWLTELAITVTELPQLFIQFFVFALSSYFFACDFPIYQKYWTEKAGADTQWLAGRVKSTVVTAFDGYLKAQGLLSVGVFVILILGFWWMGQKFAFLLAVVIAFLDFIPMIGSGLILLPWTFISFFTGDTSKSLILFSLWAITAVYRRILEPKILGEQTGLSPLLSLLSMYVGLQVAGVWGLIFAPVVVLVSLHFFGLHLFHGLFSDLNQVGLDILALFEENNKNEPE